MALRSLLIVEPSRMIIRQFGTSPILCKRKYKWYMKPRGAMWNGVLCGTDWRRENGYPENWTARGILTDGPDYTNVDGSPTPYSNGQRARLLTHRKNTEKIIFLLKAVEYAKNTHQEKLQTIEDQKQSIIARKLKPKGSLLKKKLSST